MGWKPQGNPGEFSYTTHFLDVGHDPGHAIPNTTYPGLGMPNKPIAANILSKLQVLISSARAAELSFISATGYNINDPNSAKNIFKIMNEIFNSRDTINRGLQYMKKLSSKGEGMEKSDMYRDVSRYFSFYLTKALEEELENFTSYRVLTSSPAEIKNLINNIIGNALTKTYESVKDFIGPNGEIRGKFGDKSEAHENETEVQAIKDMIHVVQKLKSDGAFGKYGYLFNLDESTLAKVAGNRNGRIKVTEAKKFNGAQVDANFGGNILELITTLVASEIGNINIANSGLKIVGQHTGQLNNMKADTILFVGRGDINVNNYLEYVDKGLDSLRAQNVDAMQRYLADLQKNIEHVIMISDKNYSIKAGFEGIAAQEKMSIANVGQMFEKFGVSDIQALINYLANCGPDMIQGDAVDGEIRTVLQSYIGYFLFDHLQIEGPKSGPNVVNLINVSGMYIPLSVYLQGLYKSIQSAASSPSSLVSVSITLGGQTEQSVWTPGTWKEFRKSHETQSFISYKILRGVADFIAGLG